MIDYAELIASVRDAQWNGLVIVWQAIWINVATYWWFGPVMLLVILTAGRRKLLRAARDIGMTFMRAHFD